MTRVTELYFHVSFKLQHSSPGMFSGSGQGQKEASSIMLMLLLDNFVSYLITLFKTSLKVQPRVRVECLKVT